MTKNIPSISEGRIDDLAIDAILAEIDNDVGPDDAAAVPKPDEQRIYSHGFTVRIHLKVPHAQTQLAKIGWSEGSHDWIHSSLMNGERSTIRGSTYLTQRGLRAKKQASLALSKLNRQLGTYLYAIEFNRPPIEDDFLILRGVRDVDVKRLLEEHLGLTPDEYQVAYYLDLERYFVIPPHIAFMLARKLAPDALPVAGRGRTSRKRWLLKDYPFPVVIRRRARRTAYLNVYRIEGGATAQYKVEISLKGRRQNKGHFTKDDIPALDAILLDLIERYDLVPMPKPERWEPRRPPQWRRDGRLAQLPGKVYRGHKVAEERVRTAKMGHTPNLRFWVNSSTSRLTCLSPPLIRNADTGHSTSTRSPAWSRIAKDLGQYEGYLSEVVLDMNQDPRELVKAIVKAEPEGSVAVGVVGADLGQGVESWSCMLDLVEAHPATNDLKTLVVVVDGSVILATDDLVAQPLNESLHHFVPGPLFKQGWHDSWCSMPIYVQATGALLSPMLEELRGICETTGQKVVLITVDARPEHGKGRLLPTHFFRDGRMRSNIGDAGRYYAHLRYLVESDDDGRPYWVGMLKDEGQGLPGRMLWGFHEVA